MRVFTLAVAVCLAALSCGEPESDNDSLAGQPKGGGSSQPVDAGVPHQPRTVLDVPANEARRYIYDYGGDRKNEKWTFDLASQVAMPANVKDVYVDISHCTDVGLTTVKLRADEKQEEIRVRVERSCEDTPYLHEARWINTPTRTLQARVEYMTHVRPAGATVIVKVLGWIEP